MTKNKIKPQTDTVSEIKLHSPHYNIIVSAQSYSNTAGVLAGFAFAAVILTVQTPPPSEFTTYSDWATIAFLLSFVGCIFSAINHGCFVSSCPPAGIPLGDDVPNGMIPQTVGRLY